MKSILKLIIYIIIPACFFSCHSGSIPQRSANLESTDSRGNPMLLGICTRERLEQKPYSEWFTRNYQAYHIDTPAASALKAKLADKHFLIFMGTWCGDSRREVPRIYKLFDYCQVKSEQVQLVMVDSHDSVYKQSPGHEERGLNIHRVPDLLIFEKKGEIGRIVESPVASLEKDLLAIVNKEGYTPHYQAASLMIEQFSKKSIPDIESDLPALAGRVKALTKNTAELNTYGYVLMAAGEMAKAKLIFQLNALVYPAEPNVFDSLGEYYFKTGDQKLAAENYRKVLQLQPANDHAAKMLGQLQNK